MGHTRAKQPRPPSRSRFFEGSMNDRASAAPPVHFLGPEELAALQKPIAATTASSYYSSSRASSEEHSLPAARPLHHKKSSIFGQVWDGVRGRLGFRRGGSTEDGLGKRRSVATDSESTTTDGSTAGYMDDRPTREEALANYHQLVASGFFSSHAIQSSRRPPPGTVVPSQPNSPQPNSHRLQPPNNPSLQPPSPQPPQWPLTPSGSKATTPVRSPASASSRGTKRAATVDDEDDGGGGGKGYQDNNAVRETAPKKLRKSVSRDVVNVPKLRTTSSRRNLLSRRSVSNAGGPDQPASREPNRLSRRVLSKLPNSKPPSAAPPNMPARGSSARRNVSDSASTRVLRPRPSASEPLCVVPDANQGIPTVPAIPLKFTYGEDRENDGPWRGLRRSQRNSTSDD
ncbi:hypothetical protein B0I35DRAFT_477480 [Stachybotrys elegans]|uniref:Uncharacterized protein n=1 Tax=Stachybotrys elegans TaxID=80388 RepID=A0A8K0SUG5_9HYPO|nr:hypothetical protein B0I35DRAFT_477480 [Stachybotrys elegans]